MKDGKTTILEDIIYKKHIFIMDRVIVGKKIFEDGIYKNSSNLTLAQLLSEESIHKVDLNKDNVIGDTVTSVISNQDSKGFYKIASGSYVIDNSGLNVGNVSHRIQ